MPIELVTDRQQLLLTLDIVLMQVASEGVKSRGCK